MIPRRSFLLFWLTIVLSSIAVQVSFAQFWNPSHAIGTISGNYNFSYNQTPDQLVELHPAVIPNTGLLYQWEQSFTPTDGFTAIAGATQTNYIVPAPLNQTTYYRRKTIYPSNSGFIYSNVIKIKLVSQNWEDRNYIREHNIITTGVTTWLAVDQLPVGSKLQTTTYLDGLGRSLQKISRETTTRANPNDTWGYVLQFLQ